MEDHQSVYKEEAIELLTELESSLIELDDVPDDMELIGHVFRCMHTIKGSGAMFGFDDVAAFTHEIETVFDLVRDGRLPVTKKLVALTLKASDLIKKMVTGQAVDPAEEREMVKAYQTMLPGPVVYPQNPGWAASDDAVEGPIPDVTYRIRFFPKPDIFHTGTNPILLMDELALLGKCESIVHQRNVPPLNQFDPLLCYLYWDIFLTSSENLNTVRDVFVFVEDHCKLDIQVIDGSGLGGAEGNRLGEILVERGDISPDLLQSVLKGKKRIGEMLLDAKAVDPDTLHSALKEQQHIREVGRRQQTTMIHATGIRVAADKLDSLVDLAGELVTVQARLTRKAMIQEDPELTSISEEVERLAAELRDSTMNIRMLPVGNAFRKFKRLIHDLSNELGKETLVITEGEETELDKTVLEQMGDPLMHLIRNTVDHGIEPPNVREAKGKPRRGTVCMAAEHSGSDVLIRISDDGSGLNLKAIRAKAVEKGLISPTAEPSEKEMFSMIFAPGFSTAKTVSGVSGRGVGMDVVKRRVEHLRGTVEIESQEEVGTTVTLKLPLTLAIADGLLVKVGQDDYIMPLLAVEECVELGRQEVEKARERNMINFRGEAVSYINLREFFKTPGAPPAIEKVVIAESGGERYGFGVDHVVGQHQTVIKGLGHFYKDIKHISGATILGDGTVALILDMAQIVRVFQNGLNKAPAGVKG
jgi:two-component system chemotaxis sensor kinase CheA